MVRLVAIRRSRDEDAGELHTTLRDATLAFWSHYQGLVRFNPEQRVTADQIRAMLVGFAKEYDE